jgi:hypothetical protein
MEATGCLESPSCVMKVGDLGDHSLDVTVVSVALTPANTGFYPTKIVINMSMLNQSNQKNTT